MPRWQPTPLRLLKPQMQLPPPMQPMQPTQPMQPMPPEPLVALSARASREARAPARLLRAACWRHAAAEARAASRRALARPSPAPAPLVAPLPAPSPDTRPRAPQPRFLVRRMASCCFLRAALIDPLDLQMTDYREDRPLRTMNIGRVHRKLIQASFVPPQCGRLRVRCTTCWRDSGTHSANPRPSRIGRP